MMPFVSALYFYGILVAKHLHSLMDIQCCESLLLNLRLRGLSWLQVRPSTCSGTLLNQNYWLHTGSRHGYANGPIEISSLAYVKLNQCSSVAGALQQQNSRALQNQDLWEQAVCATNTSIIGAFICYFPKRNWGIKQKWRFWTVSQ